MKMRIGELARMAGCQVVTIRYYEKEGLLPPPERSDGNYRLYDEAQVERLRFIRHCRLHGMTLDEIRQLLEFQENPVSDCSWVDDLVSRHIENVNSQIASLQQLKKRLEALRHECSGGRHGDCGILQSLTASDDCPFCRNLKDGERDGAPCGHRAGRCGHKGHTGEASGC